MHKQAWTHAPRRTHPQRNRGPSLILQVKSGKMEVLHLHFNLLSIRHCVWCCSKIAWCLLLVPIYRGFYERRVLNSNLPAIRVYGDEPPPSSLSSAPSSSVTHSLRFHLPPFLIFFPPSTSICNYFPFLLSRAPYFPPTPPPLSTCLPSSHPTHFSLPGD